MITSRSTAFACLQRIEADGAYANLVLPAMLADSPLDRRDRAFVTELVYGTTRMRRACDALVDRFIVKEPSADLRTLLRLGAYQLHVAGVPAHAAVGETVELAPKRSRGFVNAILRKVADAVTDDLGSEVSSWFVPLSPGGEGLGVRGNVVSVFEVNGHREAALRTDTHALLLPLVTPDDAPSEPKLYEKPNDRWELNDVRQPNLGLADEMEVELRKHL